MEIMLNGTARDIPDAATVSQLLQQLEIRTSGVAVEVNRDIVPRAEHAQRMLREGDAVEIVTFVGGG